MGGSQPHFPPPSYGAMRLDLSHLLVYHPAGLVVASYAPSPVDELLLVLIPLGKLAVVSTHPTVFTELYEHFSPDCDSSTSSRLRTARKKRIMTNATSSTATT